MLVEEIIGLQSDNERNCSNIIIIVINHGHLVLKINDVAFEDLFWLHLDGEEVIVILLKLLPRGVLVKNPSLTTSKFQREHDRRK